MHAMTLTRRGLIAAMAAAAASSGIAGGMPGSAPHGGGSLGRVERLGRALDFSLREIPHEGTMVVDHYRITIPVHMLILDGKDVLSPGGTNILTAMAIDMTRIDRTRIEVVSHRAADSDPYLGYVETKRWSEAIVAGLASRGIDPSRLAATGVGDRFPIHSNDTPLGRQGNRRVEFLVRAL